MDAVGGVRQNGEMSVLISETAWASVCSTVESRSRSPSPLSLNGSVRETYAFASPTTRMTSASAAFCRCRSSEAPTVANAPRTVASSSSSTGSAAYAGGISPKFFAIMAAVRLTRLPQPATSSLLLRCTNSFHEKSASWFSGPAAQMK